MAKQGYASTTIPEVVLDKMDMIGLIERKNTRSKVIQHLVDKYFEQNPEVAKLIQQRVEAYKKGSESTNAMSPLPSMVECSSFDHPSWSSLKGVGL